MYAMANVTKPAKEILARLSEELQVSQAGILSALVLMLEANRKDTNCVYGNISKINLEEMQTLFPTQANVQKIWELRSIQFNDFLHFKNGKKKQKETTYEEILSYMQEREPSFETWMLNSVIGHAYRNGKLAIVGNNPFKTPNGRLESTEHNMAIIIVGDAWKALVPKLNGSKK